MTTSVTMSEPVVSSTEPSLLTSSLPHWVEKKYSCPCVGSGSGGGTGVSSNRTETEYAQVPASAYAPTEM